jgi:cytochrome P450
VTKRRESPEDDLISRLIAARDDDGRLTDDELIATCVLLMIADHETTVNLITNGVLALMRHRDQWDWLVADPTGPIGHRGAVAVRQSGATDDADNR